jgi:hypothetical protein
MPPPSATNYIYWTGGYDSTYQLLQLLSRQNSHITAIYLASTIDNDPTSRIMRRSHDNEIAAMTRIRDQIRDTLGYTFEWRIVHDPIIYTDWIRDAMIKLYNNGLVRRPICQYGAMAQYAINNNLIIDVGVENEPTTSIMWNTVSPYIDSDDKICRQALWNIPGLYIFQNLRFPLIRLSKRNMFDTSPLIWIPILRQTWSCWYPTPDGNPCHRCEMCRNRLKEST